MRKINQWISSLFKETPTNEDAVKVNAMMSIIFEGRDTLDAIITFEKLKKRFEEELATRNMNANITTANVESYFKNNYRKIKVVS